MKQNFKNENFYYLENNVLSFLEGSGTFLFFSHIIDCIGKWRCIMLSALIGISFLEFLKSAVFVVRIYFTEIIYFLNRYLLQKKKII